MANDFTHLGGNAATQWANTQHLSLVRKMTGIIAALETPEIWGQQKIANLKIIFLNLGRQLSRHCRMRTEFQGMHSGYNNQSNYQLPIEW